MENLTILDVGRNRLTGFRFVFIHYFVFAFLFFLLSDLGDSVAGCRLLVKLVAYENRIEYLPRLPGNVAFNNVLLRELWLNGNLLT